MLRRILLSLAMVAASASFIYAQQYSQQPRTLAERLQGLFGGSNNRSPQQAASNGGSSHMQRTPRQQMGPPTPPQYNYAQTPGNPGGGQGMSHSSSNAPRQPTPAQMSQGSPSPSNAHSALRSTRPSTDVAQGTASSSASNSSRATSGYAQGQSSGTRSNSPTYTASSSNRPSSATYEKSPTPAEDDGRGYSSRRSPASVSTSVRPGSSDSSEEDVADGGGRLAPIREEPPEPVAVEPEVGSPSRATTGASALSRGVVSSRSTQGWTSKDAPKKPATSPGYGGSIAQGSSRATAIAKPEASSNEPKSLAAASSRVNPSPLSAKPTDNGERLAPMANEPSQVEGTSPAAAEVATPEPRVGANRGLAANGVLFRRSGPQLSVETVGPQRITIHRNAEYRLILRNSGDSAARDVKVMVNVPAWAGVVSASPTLGTSPLPAARKDEPLVWTVPELTAQGQATLELTLLPKESHSLELGVQWSSAPVSSQVNVEVQEPKLILSVKGPEKVEYGARAIYELTFDNPGTADAERVMVKLMPIDPGDSADAHEIGTIAAGSRKVVEIELVARQEGILMIRAQASAEGGLTSDVQHDVMVRRAGLKLDIVGPQFRYARTEGGYTLHVRNPGTSAAKNVQVGMMLPAGASFVSASNNGKLVQEAGQDQVRWILPSLAEGENTTLEVMCNLDQPGLCRVQAVAVADGDLRDTNFMTTEVEAVAELVLDVKDPRGPLPVGEDVQYDIVLKNRGTKAADGIQLSAVFSSGLQPLSVTGAAFEIEPQTVVLGPVRLLGPGEEFRAQVNVRANTPGNHEFRIEVRCDALDVRLSQQGTTRYYGEGKAATDSSLPAPAAPRAGEQGSRYPMPASPRVETPRYATPQPAMPQPATPSAATPYSNMPQGALNTRSEPQPAAAPFATERPAPTPSVESPGVVPGHPNSALRTPIQVLPYSPSSSEAAPNVPTPADEPMPGVSSRATSSRRVDPAASDAGRLTPAVDPFTQSSAARPMPIPAGNEPTGAQEPTPAR